MGYFQDNELAPMRNDDGQAIAARPRGQGKKVADGGKVIGPGGPTADRITAKLSNGEMVLPASTVHAIGEHTLNELIAATHVPVGSGKQSAVIAAMARARSPAFANGGSPWDAEYAKGGSLYNDRSAPAAAAPAPAVPAATQAPAAATSSSPTIINAGPSVTAPSSTIAPVKAGTSSVSGPLMPSAPLSQGPLSTDSFSPVGGSLSLSSSHGSLASRPYGNLQKVDDLRAMAGYADGGMVGRAQVPYKSPARMTGYPKFADGGPVSGYPDDRYNKPVGESVAVPQQGPVLQGLGVLDAYGFGYPGTGYTAPAERAPPPGTGGTADTRINVSSPAMRGTFDRGTGEQQLGGAATSGGLASGPIDTTLRSVPVPQQPVAVNQVPYNPALAKMQGDYAAMRATEQQDRENFLNHREQQGVQGVQRQNAYDNQIAAAGEARVRNAQARGGVFGGTPRQQLAEQAVVAGQAERADTNLRAANAAYAGALGGNPLPLRNFLDEAAKSQAISQGAQEGVTKTSLAAQQLQSGAVDIAGKNIAQQGAQLDVKQKQRLNELGERLMKATDPKEISNLHSQIIAASGHGPPEEYSVTHAPGATHANEMGAVTKDPDTLYVVHKRTGAATVYGGPQAAAAKPPDGFIGKDANGKPFKMVNGKPEPYGG